MSLLDALFLDPYPLNVWIAYRTDGVKGSGTLSDPYDGSSATKFDALMNSFPALTGSNPGTRVNLGPGVFETNGYTDAAPSAGWQPKAGMKIVGSGIDVTTLKLVNATTANAQYFAVGPGRRLLPSMTPRAVIAH